MKSHFFISFFIANNPDLDFYPFSISMCVLNHYIIRESKMIEHKTIPFQTLILLYLLSFKLDINHQFRILYEAFDFHLNYTNQHTKEPVLLLNRNKRDILTKFFFCFQQCIRNGPENVKLNSMLVVLCKYNGNID